MYKNAHLTVYKCMESYVEAFYNRDVSALYMVAKQVENEYKLTGNLKFIF